MNRLLITNFREKQDKMLHLTEGITHQLKTCSNNLQLIIVLKNSLKVFLKFHGGFKNQRIHLQKYFHVHI